jgi:hypothetical protein
MENITQRPKGPPDPKKARAALQHIKSSFHHYSPLYHPRHPAPQPRPTRALIPMDHRRTTYALLLILLAGVCVPAGFTIGGAGLCLILIPLFAAIAVICKPH